MDRRQAEEPLQQQRRDQKSANQPDNIQTAHQTNQAKAAVTKQLEIDERCRHQALDDGESNQRQSRQQQQSPNPRILPAILDATLQAHQKTDNKGGEKQESEGIKALRLALAAIGYHDHQRHERGKPQGHIEVKHRAPSDGLDQVAGEPTPQDRAHRIANHVEALSQAPLFGWKGLVQDDHDERDHRPGPNAL